jgi:hypothetical protein
MTDDTESAFPVLKDGYVQDYGMSLLDWFAGQAVIGLIAGASGQVDAAIYAMGSFAIADAMMAERDRRCMLLAEADDAAMARCKAAGISHIIYGICTTCARLEAECQCLPF